MRFSKSRALVPDFQEDQQQKTLNTQRVREKHKAIPDVPVEGKGDDSKKDGSQWTYKDSCSRDATRSLENGDRQRGKEKVSCDSEHLDRHLNDFL